MWISEGICMDVFSPLAILQTGIMAMWRAVNFPPNMGEESCAEVDKCFCNWTNFIWLGNYTRITAKASSCKPTPCSPAHTSTLEKLRQFLSRLPGTHLSPEADLRLLEFLHPNSSSWKEQPCPRALLGTALLTLPAWVPGQLAWSVLATLMPADAGTAAGCMENQSHWITASLAECNKDTWKQMLFEQILLRDCIW